MLGHERILRLLGIASIGVAVTACGSTPTDPDVEITGVVVTATPNPAELTVMVQASANVQPSSASQSVSWSSSDESVATVDASGLVTLHLRGTVTITATSTVDGTKSGSVTLTVVCPAPRRVTANISGDTTWENWVPDPDCFDYVVEASIQTNVDQLTIEAGTVVGFEQGTGVRIRIDGSLIAEGTADDPIVLTGTEEVRGHWQGLALETAATVENVLTHVTVEFTGDHDISNTQNASLILAEQSRARIESSTFRESSGYGVFLNHGVEVLGGAGNVLEANALGAAWSYGTAVHYLLDADLGGNDVDVVVVNPNTITSTVTWPRATYHVLRSAPQGFHVLEGGLTLRPGTELRFEGDQSLIVERGYLNAQGTTSDAITFTGTEQVRGHWGGIGFIGADDPMNVLEYVMVEYGGGRNIGGALERANVVITMAGADEHSSVTIRKSALWRSAEYGLWVRRDSELPGFEDNELAYNALGPAYVQAPIVDWLLASNIFNSNDVDEIAVETGSGMQLDSAATWRDLGVPYHLQYHVGPVWEVFNVLTIERGVEMLMAPDLGITMRNGGSMVAEGRELERISMRAKSTGWQGLEFRATTGMFAYIDIEDGGSVQWGAVLAPGTVTIQADAASATVTFGDEVTLGGAGYGIVFSYGQSIAFGCPGTVFVPPPDMVTDHCK